MNNKKDIFVFSGQSGAGKGTLISELRRRHLGKFYYIRSMTSRSPRTKGSPEDIRRDRENYIFLSPDQFEKEIKAGELLEWAKVHGKYYGKPMSEFTAAETANKIALVEIDVQGAEAVKKRFGDRVVSIFIVAPSLEELENRLRNRGTETEEEIRTRLKTAEEEIKFAEEYDYQVVNDEIDQAVAEIEQIMFQK